jgi:hypothetical protein
MNEKGNIIVEFAMVLWVIVIISFGGLELARALDYRQVAAVVSREAARVAYRECSVNGGGANYYDLCLGRVDIAPAFQSFATALAPGSRVVVRIYGLDAAGTNVVLLGRYPSTGTLPGFKPFDNQETNFTSMVTNHHVVVVSEAFVPYQPMLLGFSNRSLNLEGRDIYDVTVI